MTNDEIQDLIIDILTFCMFEEVPRFVSPDGTLQYKEDISYGKSRISYKFIGDNIHVCDPTGQWYPLRPLNSLDDCAWFITRISHIINHKEQHSLSDDEQKLYDSLQTEIKTTVLDLMRTLRPESILKGINSFLKRAKKRLDELDNNL